MTSSSLGDLFPAHQELLNPPSSSNSSPFQRDELWARQPQCRANVPNDKHPPSLPKMCLQFKWTWIKNKSDNIFYNLRGLSFSSFVENEDGKVK